MSDYKKIFSRNTISKLNKQSADSLKQMLKGKSFMQASMESMKLLPEIIKAEKPKRDYLENLAVMIVEDMFPIIKQAGVEIDAKLVDSPSEFGISNQEQNFSEESPEYDQSPEIKRRLINSITQGASIRGSKSFYLFKDTLDAIDDSLMQKYEDILNNAYGIYDDENAVALMMAMLSQNAGNQGGESEADYNEETGVLTIKARALIFPILLQEIIKGLYEILSLQGFTKDAEKNKEIVQQVDKTTNEPEDIRYGKFIYDALNDLVVPYKHKYPGILELFLIEVYKMEDKPFKEFIENLINNKLDSSQKIWTSNTLNNLIKNEK